MTPTPQQVEITIQELEMDEAEATAMRRFYERERQGYKIHWGKVLLGSAVGFVAVLILLWLVLAL